MPLLSIDGFHSVFSLGHYITMLPEYPHHMILLPSSFCGERCYGIHPLCAGTTLAEHAGNDECCTNEVWNWSRLLLFSGRNWALNWEIWEEFDQPCFGVCIGCSNIMIFKRLMRSEKLTKRDWNPIQKITCLFAINLNDMPIYRNTSVQQSTISLLLYSTASPQLCPY